MTPNKDFLTYFGKASTQNDPNLINFAALEPT